MSIELEEEAMAVAMDLLKGQLDDKTRIADLLLRDSGGEWWDVHRVEGEMGRINYHVDTILPRRFGSAQILASYLLRLSSKDAKIPDLPKEGKHRGELVMED